MSEPRTPEGKVLTLFLNTSAGLSDMGQFVARVEDEAATAERERLLGVHLDGKPYHVQDTFPDCVTCNLLDEKETP